MAESKLTGLSGIGTATARILEHNGFHSISDVAAATVETLCAVPGFGKIRSSSIIEEAKQIALLSDPAIQSSSSDRPTRSKRKKDKYGRKKHNAKGKAKGKGKKNKEGKKRQKKKEDGKKKQKKKKDSKKKH